jgi:hypothetical protein
MVDNVHLQPHQKAVKKHIVETCCKQPGIVLYHAVGTGKTLTAMSIISAMPASMKCTVFSPKEVTFMWHGELRRLGLTGRVDVFPLGDLGRRNIKDHLIIIDEAHIWIQSLHSSEEAVRAKATRAYTNAKKAARRIVMTGSPICNPLRGVYDIACLCNLAAGKDVFPFSQPAFQKKYTSIDIFKSVVYGWGVGLGALSTALASGAAASQISSFGWNQLAETMNPLTATGRVIMNQMTYTMGIGVLVSWFVSEQLDRVVTKSTTKFVDASRFWKDAGSLISYFDPRSVSPDFPKVSIHRVSAPLTIEQHLRWWEIANRLIDEKNIQHMGIRGTGVSSAWGSFISSTEEYLTLARRVAIYTPDDTPPKKYENALRLMMKDSIRRCVVYSELSGGIQAFKRYLDSKNVESVILSERLTDSEKEDILKRFEDQTVPVLLLSKNMYFGFTVKGARQLHVLEPVFDGATREQLYGRVNRYKSHAHLPLSQQTVDIYVHVGSLTGGLVRDHARNVIVSFRQYLKHDVHKVWGFARKQRGAFDMSMTPDEVIWTLTEESEKKSVLASSITTPCQKEWACR